MVAAPRFALALAPWLSACSPHRSVDAAAEPADAPAPVSASGAGAAASAASEPTVAAPASGEIVGLAPGVHHTCALRDGEVFCWGLNRFGVLGVGEPDREDILQPMRVLGLPPIAAVVADYDFTCALSAEHAVYCWGDGDRGQLAAPGARQSAPTRVADLVADRIVAGHARVCALGPGVRCWGSGEFGDGERRAVQLVPVAIPALAGIEALALSDGHACALRAGVVTCWGHNGSGQLGDGAGGCRDERDSCPRGRCLPPRECKHEALPVAAVGLPPIVEIAARSSFTYARDGAGKIWRMGQHGVTMDFSEDNPRYRPAVVEGLPPMVEVDAGGGHACARTAAGELWCWGNNAFGQLGHPPGPRGGIEGEARVEGLPPVKAIALGLYSSCVLTGVGADAQIWCWGDNSRGQLGDGTTERRHAPVQVRWG